MIRSVELKLNRPQKKIFDAVAPRRRIFGGLGRGIGKSYLLRRIWYLQIAEHDRRVREQNGEQIRGVRIIPIMPTLKQFKDVHGGDLLEELSPGGKWDFLRGKIDRTTWQVTFPGGSWIKPFPASAYNSRTSRGMRCDIIGADEIDDIDADVYDSVAIPWLSAPWSLGIELPFGTPTRGRHGLWFRFLEEGRRSARIRSGEISEDEALDLPEAKATLEILRSIEEIGDRSEEALRQRTLDAIRSNYAFHATYRDAPETVSPIAVARARTNTPEATFKREWEADPDAGEGLVFSLNESVHIREPDIAVRFREYHVGMDHGFVDPGVMILFGIQGHGDDAVVWALDESYESGIQPHEWDERAKLWSQATFWPDPSRPDRVAALRSMGIAVGEVDNEILAGVARVADMMFPRPIEGSDEKWVRFFVSPKCRNLIREFGLYRRKKQPDGTFAEKPEDKNNHAMDATRYFMYGRFGRAPNYRTELRG